MKRDVELIPFRSTPHFGSNIIHKKEKTKILRTNYE